MLAPPHADGATALSYSNSDASQTTGKSYDDALSAIHDLAEKNKPGWRSTASTRNGFLNAVAKCIVEKVGDLCSIELIEPDGSIACGGSNHGSPEMQELLDEMCEWYRQPKSSRYGYTNVIRTGKPEMHTHVTEAMLKNMAVDDDHLAKLKELGLKAFTCVPIKNNGGMHGTITVGLCSHAKKITVDDLAFLEQAAVILCNALDG